MIASLRIVSLHPRAHRSRIVGTVEKSLHERKRDLLSSAYDDGKQPHAYLGGHWASLAVVLLQEKMFPNSQGMGCILVWGYVHLDEH